MNHHSTETDPSAACLKIILPLSTSKGLKKKKLGFESAGLVIQCMSDESVSPELPLLRIQARNDEWQQCIVQLTAAVELGQWTLQQQVTHGGTVRFNTQHRTLQQLAPAIKMHNAWISGSI